MFLKHTRSVGGLLDFDRRLCCKLHIIRLRTRIKEMASWVPPRVAQAASGAAPTPLRARIKDSIASSGQARRGRGSDSRRRNAAVARLGGVLCEGAAFYLALADPRRRA